MYGAARSKFARHFAYPAGRSAIDYVTWYRQTVDVTRSNGEMQCPLHHFPTTSWMLNTRSTRPSCSIKMIWNSARSRLSCTREHHVREVPGSTLSATFCSRYLRCLFAVTSSWQSCPGVLLLEPPCSCEADPPDELLPLPSDTFIARNPELHHPTNTVQLLVSPVAKVGKDLGEFLLRNWFV